MSPGDLTILVVLLIGLVAMAFLAGKSYGRESCKEDHYPDNRCKCGHQVESHATTVPCVLCECKDFEGMTKEQAKYEATLKELRVK